MRRFSHKVRGVSPQAGIESMVGKICERGRFRARSKRVGELHVDGESGESTEGCGIGKRQVRGRET